VDWERNALPTLRSSEDDVKAYIQRTINPISPRRRWVTQRAALNAWMYHGRQWIEPVGELTAGQGVYHFREVYKQSVAAYKRPVTNIIAPAVDNEVARLTKKEYVPEAAASRNQPDWIAAAALAKDIVTWRMAQSMWAEKREQVAFNLCIDETAIVRSFWDEIVTDLVPVGSMDAVMCSSCEKKLASATLPASMVETGVPMPGGGFAEFMNAESVEEGPFVQGQPHSVVAKRCPFCPTGELKPYAVSEEEVLEVPDALGNPLGRMLPRGNGGVEVVSLHNFYPENGGIGVEPYDCKVWHQKTPMAIEDVVQRWPQFEKTIQPDDPQKILRLNPLYSDPALVTQGLFGLAAHGMDAYQNHVLVDEVVVARQSRPGLEHGAHFIMVNDELISRPLCIEIEAENGVEYVSKVRYHVARAKRVPGMFWGRGFVSDLVPLQRRLNELDAQVIDLRERGKPMMWAPQGVELYFRKDTEGSMQVMEYETAEANAPNWSPRDGVFPGIPMTGNPYMQERQQIMVDSQLIGAPQDIELGRGAGGIKTTSGMMLAQEQAGTKREPRERGLVAVYEGVFQHVLDMEKSFQYDEQKYQVTSDAGIHEIKSYDRTQLVGTIKLKMKASAGYDQAIYEKEATSEAIGMGLYDLSSPVDIQQALKGMRLPQSVNEGFQVQIRRAEMAWSDFVREETVPLLDEQLYNPSIWFPIFQKRWLGDECLVMQRDVDFEAVWARLAGWPEVLMQLEAEDAILRQLYEGHDPSQWQQLHQQAMALYENAVGQLRATGVIGPMGPPPPGSGLEQPPPAPPDPAVGFLPKQRELRIYTVWERMLGPLLKDALLAADVSEELEVDVNEDAARVRLLMLLLKMRAVIEALRMGLEARMLGAGPAPGAAPPPGAPAPGPAGGGGPAPA
jgi:hypothetical protein